MPDEERPHSHPPASGAKPAVRLPVLPAGKPGAGAGGGDEQETGGLGWIWAAAIATAMLLFVFVSLGDAIVGPRVRRAFGGRVPRTAVEARAALERIPTPVRRRLAWMQLGARVGAALLAGLGGGVIVGRFGDRRPRLQAAIGVALVFVVFGLLARLPYAAVVLGPFGLAIGFLGAWLGTTIRTRVGH